MRGHLATARARSARAAGLAALTALTALAVGAPASAASGVGTPPDTTIAGERRALSEDEVRGHDVTDSERGAQGLARARERGLDTGRRSYRVYAFGEQELVVSAGTEIEVWTGANAAGDAVYEIAPVAAPVDVPAQGGYAVPPASAFKYNNEGSFQKSVGTWYRSVWWTMTKANDYRACSTCTAYDYWRLHGKMQASTITGSSSNEGFKRAWLEFDRKNDWSPASFEPGEPDSSYGGVANQTTTVGFGTTFGFNLGAPPVQASGSVNTTYGGSMTKSSENWHPVVKGEIASWGVQWCRYESAEFTGTKMVAARASGRVGSSASITGWYIYTGQQDYTSSCPSQV